MTTPTQTPKVPLAHDEEKLQLLIKVALTELPLGAEHATDTIYALYHTLVDGYGLAPEDAMRAMLRVWAHDLDGYVLVFSALAKLCFNEEDEAAPVEEGAQE